MRKNKNEHPNLWHKKVQRYKESREVLQGTRNLISVNRHERKGHEQRRVPGCGIR